MSVKTWKTEFYPVRAQDTTEENAIEHSIKKWTGLLKKNLKKHNVVKNINENSRNMLEDKVQTEVSFRFYVDASTCALCRHWEKFEGCFECPLKLMLGHRCDVAGLRGRNSLYGMFLDGNARPMLNALKKLAR